MGWVTFRKLMIKENNSLVTHRYEETLNGHTDSLLVNIGADAILRRIFKM